MIPNFNHGSNQTAGPLQVKWTANLVQVKLNLMVDIHWSCSDWDGRQGSNNWSRTSFASLDEGKSRPIKIYPSKRFKQP